MDNLEGVDIPQFDENNTQKVAVGKVNIGSKPKTATTKVSKTSVANIDLIISEIFDGFKEVDEEGTITEEILHKIMDKLPPSSKFQNKIRKVLDAETEFYNENKLKLKNEFKDKKAVDLKKIALKNFNDLTKSEKDIRVEKEKNSIIEFYKKYNEAVQNVPKDMFLNPYSGKIIKGSNASANKIKNKLKIFGIDLTVNNRDAGVDYTN